MQQSTARSADLIHLQGLQIYLCTFPVRIPHSTLCHDHHISGKCSNRLCHIVHRNDLCLLEGADSLLVSIALSDEVIGPGLIQLVQKICDRHGVGCNRFSICNDIAVIRKLNLIQAEKQYKECHQIHG